MRFYIFYCSKNIRESHIKVEQIDKERERNNVIDRERERKKIKRKKEKERVRNR